MRLIHPAFIRGMRTNALAVALAMMGVGGTAVTGGLLAGVAALPATGGPGVTELPVCCFGLPPPSHAVTSASSAIK